MRVPTLLVVLASLAGLSAGAQTVGVNPTGETRVVPRGGVDDLDVALWPNSAAPQRSLIIVSDPSVGLTTYGLDGGEQEVRQGDGVSFGVDVHDSFALPGANAPLIVVANASRALNAYVVDPLTLGLRRVDMDTLRVPNFEPRTVALYRSASSGRFYAFAANAAGTVQQLELSANQDGGVEGAAVRNFDVGGALSGAVADDQQGALFVAQQNEGIWRYSAEPNGGSTRERVATPSNGFLEVPLGGLSLYALADGDGYLVAASAGGNRVVLFRRKPPHEIVGAFSVQANGTIDAVTGPNSIEVSSRALGTAYPGGIVVVHDAQNDPTQNHKFVSWQSVASAFSPPLRSSAQPSPDGGVDGGTDGGKPGGGGGGTGGGGGSIPSEEGGCGCAAASVPGTVLFLVVGLALRGRRRRG